MCHLKVGHLRHNCSATRAFLSGRADIDGSGTTDIIYLHAGGPKLHFNQSGNSFSAPQQLNSLPVGDRHRQVRVADILGRGPARLVLTAGS